MYRIRILGTGVPGGNLPTVLSRDRLATLKKICPNQEVCAKCRNPMGVEKV